jgi:MFS family permease
LFGEESDVLRRRNFQLLLLATVVPSLGTALVSPLLDGLITPFGTPPANIGLMMSIFIAPAIGLVPVLGVLADRYGQKPMLVGSLLLFGMAGAAIVFTTDFRVVLALRYLQGIGFAGINPTIIMSVGNFLQR